MRLLVLLLCAVVFGASPVARAEENAVVLELFTSQGCSSCPPADAILADLADHPGVIALALHVDYWDYLGWKDSFGHAAHSARQRAYAKWDGKRSVYTPQMVVQGQRMFIGHDRKKIERSIERFRALPPQVALSVRRDGEGLRISLKPRGPLTGPIDIHVVGLLPAASVTIGAGENAGRKVDYTNIVTRWDTIARWDGQGPVELVHRGLDATPVAVIVQRAGIGPVLTAAKLP